MNDRNPGTDWESLPGYDMADIAPEDMERREQRRAEAEKSGQLPLSFPPPTSGAMRQLRRERKIYQRAPIKRKLRILKQMRSDTEARLGRELDSVEVHGLRLLMECDPDEMARKIWGDNAPE